MVARAHEPGGAAAARDALIAMSDWIDVAPADELPPGSHRAVDVDGAQVAIFNLDGNHYGRGCVHP